MRKLFAVLFAAFYLAATVAAQAGFLINPYVYATGGTPHAVLTFLQCASADNSNLTTYTFAAQNVGTASATRYTIGTIGALDSATAFTVSTVTVNGDSATIAQDAGGVTVAASAAVFILSNPAGTSEDVVVTFSEAITSARICLWSATDISSTTKVDGTSVQQANGNAATLSINVSAWGVAVGMCVTNDTTNLSYTWTGMTERMDDNTGAEQKSTAADFTNDGTGDTPLAITSDVSTNPSQQSCSTASFL